MNPAAKTMLGLLSMNTNSAMVTPSRTVRKKMRMRKSFKSKSKIVNLKSYSPCFSNLRYSDERVSASSVAAWVMLPLNFFKTLRINSFSTSSKL